MNLEQAKKPKGQTVGFVELFFDLVFVFSITQLVGLLHHDFTWLVVGQSILIFWLIWWAWTQFSWSLNTVNTENSFVAINVLLATGIAFFMAVSVPNAFHDGAMWFAVPYLLVRVIGNVLSYVVSQDDPAFRAGIQRWIFTSIGGGAAVFVGALLPGPMQYWLWGLAILLDIYAANSTGRQGEFDWNISAAHFAERHGLFVIIALGETLILVGSGTSDGQWTSELLSVTLLTVAITAGLWWSYFPRAMPALEHALSKNDGATQAKIAVDAYSFMHFLMLGGVIAYAVAIEQAVLHPTEALPIAETVALGIGLFMFVSGMTVAEWRGTGEFSSYRFVINLATSVLVIASFGQNVIVTLVIAFIGILAVGLLEEKKIRSH